MPSVMSCTLPAQRTDYSKAVRPDLGLKRQRAPALGRKLADSVYEVLG